MSLAYAPTRAELLYSAWLPQLLDFVVKTSHFPPGQRNRDHAGCQKLVPSVGEELDVLQPPVI